MTLKRFNPIPPLAPRPFRKTLAYSQMIVSRYETILAPAVTRDYDMHALTDSLRVYYSQPLGLSIDMRKPISSQDFVITVHLQGKKVGLIQHKREINAVMRGVQTACDIHMSRVERRPIGYFSL